MKRRYSGRYSPPAPVLRLRVRARSGAQVEQLEALVDTGSDICALPKAVVEMLDLSPVRVATVAGVFGQSDLVVYRADFDVEGMMLPKLEVLAAHRPYALVGRNALRRLWLGLDGPRSELELFSRSRR